ncbi:unnamed protein product [Paramecium pentaurelia]|uniref:Tetratricopeptide repeat protein n=1 Tax=Paramecium pentaurelia TaxID=43138 RepID=A0A8S1V6K2_9CILI|nr:unnamed protein product [Paramecium pentaurelia]
MIFSNQNSDIQPGFEFPEYYQLFNKKQVYISKMSQKNSKENENAAALAHYKRNQEFIINYKTEEALLEINNALDLCPQFAEAYTLRSKLYEKMKLYDKALEDVNYSISINNNNAACYYQRGIKLVVIIQATIYWRKLLFDLALQDCMKCLQNNTEFAIGYSRMSNQFIGSIMRSFKQKDNELQYLNKLQKKMAIVIRPLIIERFQLSYNINPKFSIAYYNRGNLYTNIGDKDKALSDYNQAILLDPDNAKAYYNRGNLYQTIGDKDKALRDYNQAIQLDPKFSIAYNNRGNLYKDIGEKDKALSDYNQAIQLDTKYVDLYFNRAIYIKLLVTKIRHQATIIKQYNLILNMLMPIITEVNTITLNTLSNLYQAIGDKVQALSDYQQGLSLSPNHSFLLCNLGSFYYILSNHTQQAYECYQTAINSLESLKQSEIAQFQLIQRTIKDLINMFDILKNLEQGIEQSKQLLEKLPTETPQEQQNKKNYSTKIEQYQNEIKPILTIPINQSIELENQQVQNEQLNQILLYVKQLKQEILQQNKVISKVQEENADLKIKQINQSNKMEIKLIFIKRS